MGLTQHTEREKMWQRPKFNSQHCHAIRGIGGGADESPHVCVTLTNAKKVV